MRLVLLGAPGAGKGTQADMLSEELHIPKLSTGEMVRAEVASGTKLGKEIKDIIHQGKLVSDDVMIDLVKARILKNDCENGFILDGFPRTIPQAKALGKMIDQLPTQGFLVINFVVGVSDLVKRISGRYTCKSCNTGYHNIFKQPAQAGICDKCGSKEFVYREDDKPEAVKVRIDIYNEKTAPLIEYYKKNGAFREVDGMGTISTINAKVKALVNGLGGGLSKAPNNS